ncbi:MAG: PEP-CTERM sorting domain-containing protein [Bryobacteraceae bacterium]|nr:PEP-CTERM sorting domain-containing protein [Bryobacteraceae bacterium]
MHRIALYLFLIATVVLPVGAAPLFVGPFDIGNWTFATEGTGSVNLLNAPDSITLFGSDCGSPTCPAEQPITTFEVVYGGPDPIVFTFPWLYFTDDDNAGFDPFGYFLNDTFVELTDPGLGDQSGVTSVPLVAGDRFGFFISTTDNRFGRASADIGATSAAVPEPAAFLFMGSGLALIGLSRRILGR